MLAGLGLALEDREVQEVVRPVDLADLEHLEHREHLAFPGALASG